MNQKTKDEIRDYLNEIDCYNINDSLEIYYDDSILNTIKSEIENILKNKNYIIDYKVVCDETNNTPYLKKLNMIAIDIYTTQSSKLGYIVNDITITPGKNEKKILRKTRKKKLKKIFSEYERF